MYSSYSSKDKENVYATWPKERNTWSNDKKYPSRPSSPPPPLLPPPIIKRSTKPINTDFVLKKGYIEVDY
jgi:hypothetical protein